MPSFQKLIYLILVCLMSSACSDKDTVSIYSDQMKIKVKNTVILPEDYSGDSNYPVLYLLHGYNENHKSFLKIMPELRQKATEYGIIFVCPDVGNNYYWNSPLQPDLKYETYISEELVNYIDRHYNTISSPEGRGITGFSLGGQGSIWLAMNHPDVYGACGAMSGIMDIRPFYRQWGLKNLLGDYEKNPDVWNRHTVIENVDKFLPDFPEIIIDCGTDDFAFDVNRNMHDKLTENGISHIYRTKEGDHNYEYWAGALKDQLLFFRDFFGSK